MMTGMCQSATIPKNSWQDLTLWERRKLLELSRSTLVVEMRKRRDSSERNCQKFDALQSWAAEFGIWIIRRKQHGRRLTEFLVGGEHRTFVIGTYAHRGGRLEILGVETSASSEEAALERVKTELDGTISSQGI